ncbi:signal peptidase I [Kitasatospora sp. NBC_01287]|uniref:signal peptidase I n=1 Tax=Kitasatospora sp. NBC_01287 TaxID=2903573 RepID=UPI00225B8566|nr:signal peptidase I [Kitasatospora sp. NBC_01287]MCX4746558.1 signal peptidase I [Kitasatospora sp. NBC_01287]
MGSRGRAAPPAEEAVEEIGEEVAEEPGTPRGRAQRRRTARRAARRGRRSLLREIPVIAVVALLIALTLKTFFVQVFVIPSGSMEQTIQIGDRVLVDKLTPWFGSTPQRGDIVVFKDPGGWLEGTSAPNSGGPVLGAVKDAFGAIGLLPSSNEQDLIKRVIGVGGDTVACCDDHGRITVNGKPIEEPYLAPGNPPSRIPFKVTVPEGRLWVMGDHRDLSADSRYHMAGPFQGTVPLSNVIGRAFLVGWPLNRVHGLSRPTYATPAALGSQSSGESSGVSPDPLEPSLVMGMLGISPAVLRRRRGALTGGSPADRRRWRAARRSAGAD